MLVRDDRERASGRLPVPCLKKLIERMDWLSEDRHAIVQR
jgi:hypothetical protein